MLIVLPLLLIAVSVAIVIHYETLRFASRRARAYRGRPRIAVISGVILVLVAHLIEVWIFALGYFVLTRLGGVGALRGDFSGGILDCSYYSLVVYTSVGFGDITPVGPLRIFTSVEALTGLVLIAWTASFMFLQMQEQWRRH